MKRILLILFTPLATLLVLWALADLWVLPRLATWLQEEAVSRTQATGLAELKITKLRLQLLPPAAEILGVEVMPKGDLTAILTPIKAHSVRLRLDLFEIFLGRAEIAALVISDLEGGMHLDPLMNSKEPARPLPMEDIFGWADKIPLKRLILENALWTLDSVKNQINGHVQARTLVLRNRDQRLRLDTNIPEIAVQRENSRAAVTLSAALSAELTPRILLLQDLRLRRDRLVLRAQGSAEDVANLPLKPRLKLKAEADIPLSQLAEEITAFTGNVKLPPVSGTLALETDINLQGTTHFESSLLARTQAVKVGHLEVGDASLEGKLTQQALQVKRIVLGHPAGQAELTGTTLEFRKPFSFRTELRTKQFDLQALFHSLNLKQIPVEIMLAGTLPCEGELSPLRVNCKGRISADQLRVRTKNQPDAKTIVALKDLETEGETTITSQNVSFNTQLRVGSSRGQVQGDVNFEKGFNINFKTPSLAFKDVEDLAGLKFEGSAPIEGYTKGNSDTAMFDLKIATRDFVFENYTLGNVTSKLRLQRGHLLFDDVTMNLGRTVATGFMDLDLTHDQIAGSFQSGFLEAADLVTVFSRIWTFPFEVQSTGNARMDFDGPLNFWKMNYNLEANFRNGRLQGDSFDSLQLVAHAMDGDLTIKKAEMRKNQSLLRVSGGISNRRQMDLTADLSNFRLEESEFVSRIRNNLSGQFNTAGQIKGPVTDPDVNLRGTLSDVIADEQEIASSHFNLHINRDRIVGDTNLFGNSIQGNVQLPLRDNAGPLRVRLKTSEWSFTSLLSLIGAGALQNEYESNLNSDIDLQSESGRLDQISGQVHVRDLSIKRGNFSLRNPDPIDVRFTNGTINLKNFYLEGPGQASIRLRGDSFRMDQLNLAVTAKADLRLLQMFTPFLEDLGGPMSMEATMSGTAWKPQVLGNASIKNTFVRLKGFPHPLEKVHSDIVFSHSRILVQNLEGQLAGGTFHGEGSVLINGIGDIPVNIRVQAEGLNLNVPDKVKTSGSANLLFSGRWFPFVLSGSYQVNSALIEKEFVGDGNTGNAQLRVSPYLPKILRQSQFDPVVLDLQILMDRNIVIRNSLMEGTISGNLQVKGPPQNPVLLGKINLDKNSKIIIKDKSFEVTAGTINFNTPDEVNPDLYLTAQTRVNEYDVSVLVQGPSKNPTIRMSSVPPLPEQDIISLLALGMTSQKMDNNNQSRSQAEQLGYEALGIGLSRSGFSKGVQNTLGINVQITSSYDNTRNISVPKWTLTKRLSNRLNAVYLRPMNSDTGSQEFKLQYQLNSNISAIGSYEERDGQEGSLQRDTAQKRDSIFGLDLEFKREFK